MQRTIPKTQAIDVRHRTAPSEAPKRNDLTSLGLLLVRGFSGAQNYDEMGRNRYYLSLCEGIGIDRLLDFCTRYLEGSPIPDGRDVFQKSKVLLPMFKAAQEAGLVKLELVSADKSFTPEYK